MRALFLSFFYLVIRKFTILFFYFIQNFKKNPRNLEPAIRFGDTFLCMIRRFPGHQLLFSFRRPPLQPVKLYNLSFPSPITFAAFKSEIPILELWLKMGIGGGSIKTILKERRLGNEQPRIQEFSMEKSQPAIINAMGLPGPGIDGLLADKKLKKLFKYNCPIGFSIGGGSLVEYQENATKIINYINSENLENVYLEVNISCPNTHEGQDLLSNPDLLDNLLGFIRNKTDIVTGVKLSPDQSNESLNIFLGIIAKHANMYVNLGNTTTRKDSRISVGKGGLSGAPLFERTLEMIHVAQPFDIPIVATGGITDAARVKVALKNGATLVGMATALVVNPYSIVEINKSLVRK